MVHQIDYPPPLGSWPPGAAGMRRNTQEVNGSRHRKYGIPIFSLFSANLIIPDKIHHLLHRFFGSQEIFYLDHRFLDRYPNVIQNWF
jgi:hypothetical protein